MWVGVIDVIMWVGITDFIMWIGVTGVIMWVGVIDVIMWVSVIDVIVLVGCHNVSWRNRCHNVSWYNRFHNVSWYKRCHYVSLHNRCRNATLYNISYMMFKLMLMLGKEHFNQQVRSITLRWLVVRISLTSSGTLIPFNYIPLASLERNLTQSQSTWLVSIMGATNIAGRVIVGAAASKAPFHPPIFMIAGYGMGAAATSISVLCNSFTLLAIYCGFFGLVFGMY